VVVVAVRVWVIVANTVSVKVVEAPAGGRVVVTVVDVVTVAVTVGVFAVIVVVVLAVLVETLVVMAATIPAQLTAWGYCI